MSNYNPLWALVIFSGLSVLIYFIFRPGNGWFWLIRSGSRFSQKVLIEDILKFLYHSENENRPVDINDISRTIKDPDKEIVESLKEMASIDLISLSGNHVKLTKSGSDYALRMVRAHRLWEKFLAEKTGYAETDWHHIAEKMEHELSHDDTEKLAEKLGFPQFDPHGDPIPTNSGRIAPIPGITLSDLYVDTIGRITHIKDKPDVVYRQILAENIHIGSHIRVVEKDAERIVFHSEGEAFVLAPIVASNITVNVLKKEISFEENVVRLSSLGPNEKATIVGISREIRGEARRRLLDLGFVKGAEVSLELENPLGDPKAFLIKGTNIALRHHQASKILIKKA